MTHEAPAGIGQEFGEADVRLALKWRPRLYYQVTEEEHISFEHVVKAWAFGHCREGEVDAEERRASVFLERLARKRFSAEHGGITKDYLEKTPPSACALTGDHRIHSLMNSNDPELVVYEDQIHQLSRDAHRTFAAAARRRDGKAADDLAEVGEMLYSVLTHVIEAASVLENDKATPQERDNALVSTRIQWRITRAAVEEMIQRQARFEYFQGVGLGALLTIPVLAVAGWAAIRFGANQFSEPGEPGSFAAAIIGGAAGAVVSVTQRMTSRTRAPLALDFTAPKQQKVALGALRPLVGAVFGAMVYFAVIGGLLAVDARTGSDASVALAFFAVTGFAAGFNERFATDVLTRAGSKILPPASEPGAERPDELSLLLNEQQRHAGARPDQHMDSAGGAQQADAPPPRHRLLPRPRLGRQAGDGRSATTSAPAEQRSGDPHVRT